jgi:hypothetical protein
VADQNRPFRASYLIFVEPSRRLEWPFFRGLTEDLLGRSIRRFEEHVKRF